MTCRYTRRALLTAAVGIAGAAVAMPMIGRGRGVENPVVLRGTTMGTTYRVTIPQLPAGVGADKVDLDLRNLLERIDATMSTYRADSDLSRFNRAAPGEWIPVSADTSTVAAAAIAMAEYTGGTFDPTVGPLVDLWGFGPSGPSQRIPDTAAVTASLAQTGWSAFEGRQGPPALCKRRDGLRVDFSGIAEGFAVDRMAERLDRYGVPDFLIELGGEVRCQGRNLARRPWTIAIEMPGLAAGRSQRRIGVSDTAIATSGDYRNFFIVDGRRYSHVIDPRNGQPVDHDLASVTVVGGSAMQCDALATALLVMGPDAGFAFAEHRQIAALFTTRREVGLAELMTAPFVGYVGDRPA
jgi:FAD:protein FMN transferase